jgi:RNA polymerase sigma-70 factor, ECF subfamily
MICLTESPQGASRMPHEATAPIEMYRTGPTLSIRTDRDGALVAALRRGDPMAADDLVATYGDRAGRLAMRITGSAEDAEEAVQDAFLSVIRRIDTFRGDSAFGSWLYRIVANAAYQRLRTRRGRSGDISLDNLLPVFDARGQHVAPVPDWSMSLEDPARQTELRMVLDAAIEELPADYRAVVLLRDVEGLSHREIGEALGLTVVNVKTRVHRARLFLRKRLQSHLSVTDIPGGQEVA